MYAPAPRAARLAAIVSVTAAAALCGGCRNIEFTKSWSGRPDQVRHYRLAVVDTTKPLVGESDVVGEIETSSDTQGYGAVDIQSDFEINERHHMVETSNRLRHELQHAYINRDGALIQFKPDPDSPLPPYACRIKPRVVQFDPGSPFLRIFPGPGAMHLTVAADVIDSQSGQVIATTTCRSVTTGGGYTTEFDDVLPMIAEQIARTVDAKMGPPIQVRTKPIVVDQPTSQAAQIQQDAGAAGIAKAADKPSQAKIEVEYPFETTKPTADLLVHVMEPEKVDEVDVSSLDGKNSKKQAVKDEKTVKVSLQLAKGPNVITVFAKDEKGDPVAQVDLEIMRHK